MLNFKESWDCLISIRTILPNLIISSKILVIKIKFGFKS